MPDGAVVRRSWFRQYWSFILRLIIYVGMAALLGVFLGQKDIALGIAAVLFMLQQGIGYGLLGLIGKWNQQHLLDTREATRRMWIVQMAQTATVLVITVALLFSAVPLLALAALLLLSFRVFVAVRVHRLYTQEPPGTYPRKGIFD